MLGSCDLQVGVLTNEAALASRPTSIRQRSAWTSTSAWVRSRSMREARRHCLPSSLAWSERLDPLESQQNAFMLKEPPFALDPSTVAGQ